MCLPSPPLPSPLRSSAYRTASELTIKIEEKSLHHRCADGSRERDGAGKALHGPRNLPDQRRSPSWPMEQNQPTIRQENSVWGLRDLEGLSSKHVHTNACCCRKYLFPTMFQISERNAERKTFDPLLQQTATASRDQATSSVKPTPPCHILLHYHRNVEARVALSSRQVA